MSPAQVAAASKGAAPLGKKGGWDKRPYVVGNFGTASINGLAFEAAFYFEDSALAHIRTYRNAECPDMKAFLTGKLGKPTTENDHSGFYVGTWNLAASRSRVELFASASDCRVVLTAIAA